MFLSVRANKLPRRGACTAELLHPLASAALLLAEPVQLAEELRVKQPTCRESTYLDFQLHQRKGRNSFPREAS